MLLQLLERGLETEASARSGAYDRLIPMCAQARVAKVEVESHASIETLVQEAKHSLGRRQSQAQVELQVELLEIAALEALKDHLVPAKARQGQGGPYRRVTPRPVRLSPARPGRVAGRRRSRS